MLRLARFLRLGVVGMLLLALLLVVWNVSHVVRFDTAEGVVTEVIVNPPTPGVRGSGITYRPVIRFTDSQGRVRTARTRRASSGYRFKPGTRLVIAYPEEAQWVSIVDWRYTIRWPIRLLLLSAGALWLSRRVDRRAAGLPPAS